MKKLLAALGVSLGLMLGTAPASAAIMLTFTPATSHINVGDSVVIDVSISGLGAEILSAYDLNFLYNPSLLNWEAITTFFGEFGSVLGPNNNGLPEGNLGIDLSSLEADATLAASQADSFQLFSFQLLGIADGVTNFTLGPDLDFERNFVGLNALSLDVTVGSACIAIGTGVCQQAPEPPSLALIGLALVGAFAASRRRRGKIANG